MRWLIGSAPDFWGRGPGFESGIYHNTVKIHLRIEGGTSTSGQKIYTKKISCYKVAPSASRLSKRVFKNVEYFQSNYVLVFLGKKRIIVEKKYYCT